MRAWFVISTALLWGCGGPVVFQGQSTLPVTGAPPAAVAEAKPPPPRVEVRDNKIEIHDKIQFDYDKATIRSESFSLMNEIAAVIHKNPQIKKIRIEGNASSEGSAQHNQKLSEDRARSVMKYLTDHGVATGELAAIGHGADRPIADNGSEAGREQNRRVEFVIVEQDVTHKKVEIDARTGAEKVVDENHEVVRAADADAGAQGATKPGAKGAARPATAAKKKGG
jgi:OOP family OmpA-OmpF porin